MLSPIALVVLAATTLSIAAPVSDSQSTAAVFKRADIKPVSCGRMCYFMRDSFHDETDDV
jgi:hypothetical protein